MPVEVDEIWLAELKAQIGELPAARRERYIDAVGLSPSDAATLAGDRETGDLLDSAVAAGATQSALPTCCYPTAGAFPTNAAFHWASWEYNPHAWQRSRI